jgi:hypothetical protein
MKVKRYTEFLAETAKPKPADVIVQSLETSPAAAGLRALGARVKSVGQHRVRIAGKIPIRTVETPEHPDNRKSMWRSYRTRPTRNPVYSEGFFPDLDSLWKDMWENVVKNLSILRVPGKRNLDTVSELRAKGIDHTSELDVEGLRMSLEDPGSIPDTEKILDEISDLVADGWEFLFTPKVNFISLEVKTPRDEILKLYNVPLKGVRISGSVTPRGSHFALALTKMDVGRRPHEKFLYGDEKSLAGAIRQELQSRMKSFHGIDFVGIEVNGVRMPEVLRTNSPFPLYISKMGDFLKEMPVEDLFEIDGKILDEAKRIFRSESGSVMLAYLDERYGMEPKSKGMSEYRMSLFDTYEKHPEVFEQFMDAIPEQKKDAILGPDLSVLIKANNLIL